MSQALTLAWAVLGEKLKLIQNTTKSLLEDKITSTLDRVG